jgi:eukaryotic-like serine/threonine-protein kinase
VAGPASDTFSLGSVLAFAASGSVPFSGGAAGSSASVMYRVVHAEPDLAAVPVGGIRELVLACLEKDARQRPDLGRVAAHATLAAERLGLSPAAFWPAEVAAVIQRRESELTAEVSALRSAPPAAAGAWGAAGPATGKSPYPAPAAPPGAGAYPGRFTGTVSAPAAQAGAGAAGRDLGSGATAKRAASRGPRGMARRGMLGAVSTLGFVGAILVVGRRLGESAAGSAPATDGNPAFPAGPRRPAAWTFPADGITNGSPGAGIRLAYDGDTEGNVYAVDMATGRQAWRYGAQDAVSAAPEVTGDILCLATTAGHFYALRAASGKPAWDVDTGVAADGSTRNWAVHGRSVILASASGPARAHDAATGAPGVSFRTQDSVQALIATGGVLYALDDGGVLYAFAAGSGAALWQRRVLSAGERLGTGLAVGGGRVYLGAESGTLYVADAAAGHVQWAYHAGHGLASSLAVAGDMVYLRDDSMTVQAISAASRKQAWTRDSDAGDAGGLAVAGGRVYYGVAFGLQALDAASGRPAWSFGPPGVSVSATPTVAGGLVLASSASGMFAVRA